MLILSYEYYAAEAESYRETQRERERARYEDIIISDRML